MGRGEQDRITVNIWGWRERLQVFGQEPGLTMSTLSRHAIITAIEFWEAAEELGLAVPRPGRNKMKEWLIALSGENLGGENISLKTLIDTKGSLGFLAQEAALPVERIIEIRNSHGSFPTMDEMIGLTRALEISFAELERLIRDQYKEKESSENGY